MAYAEAWSRPLTHDDRPSLYSEGTVNNSSEFEKNE